MAKINMQFDPQVAAEVGVEEAIMLSNIEYWCAHNRANGRHEYDGHYWTYNSMAAYEQLFTFWTQKQIKRILKNLEEGEYIKTGNYNAHKYDRTKWYTCISPNGQMEKTEQSNGSAQAVEPIPDSKPNNKPYINIGAKKQKKFVQPTIEEVQAYIEEKGYNIDAIKWYSYYESNGWKVGRNKMANWRATVTSWSRDDRSTYKRKTEDTVYSPDNPKVEAYKDFDRFRLNDGTVARMKYGKWVDDRTGVDINMGYYGECPSPA